jgi:glutamine cyclotransferase
MRNQFYLLVLFVLCTLSCTQKSDQKNFTPRISYTVQNTFPHDTKAFTEGLLIHEGKLYESTGEDESWIGVVNHNTGVVDKKVVLGKEYFGEGITILNNKIYQLTYKTKKGFVYDLKSFTKLREFTYKTQGWGLTHDSHHLIMSDGTDRLYFIDTTSFSVTKTITVTDHSGPLSDLNELEFADGFIYANVFNTDKIVKIDPSTGVVKGIIDLTALENRVRETHPKVDVLNGIAWHPDTKQFLVTGKYWPSIFVLKLQEEQNTSAQ